jgi:hypothetical protein
MIKQSIPNIGVFYWECKTKKHASLAGGPFFNVFLSYSFPAGSQDNSE